MTKEAKELGRHIETAEKLAAEIQETEWGRPFASALEGQAAVSAEYTGLLHSLRDVPCRLGEMQRAAWDGDMAMAAQMASEIRKDMVSAAIGAAHTAALCNKFMRDKEGWQ